MCEAGRGEANQGIPQHPRFWSFAPGEVSPEIDPDQWEDRVDKSGDGYSRGVIGSPSHVHHRNVLMVCFGVYRTSTRISGQPLRLLTLTEVSTSDI